MLLMILQHTSTVFFYCQTIKEKWSGHTREDLEITFTKVIHSGLARRLCLEIFWDKGVGLNVQMLNHSVIIM